MEGRAGGRHRSCFPVADCGHAAQGFPDRLCAAQAGGPRDEDHMLKPSAA